MATELKEKPKLKRGFTTKRKKLEQDLEHVTQEMYRKNLEIVTTNRTLSLLRSIDTMVLESHDSLDILGTQITKAIVDNSDYSMVAIFSRAHARPRLNLCGFSITDTIPVRKDEKIPQLSIDLGGKWLEGAERTTELKVDHLSDKQIAQHLNITTDAIKPLRQRVPVARVHLVKLMARQKLVGVMAIGFINKQRTLNTEDEALIERLSEAVGVAVDSKLLFEENQRVLKQLQTTNDKLRALDEAKDEFISMASHQLRTPLTSVKGYVSMVLEGDAGKVPKNQKNLLDQAFASSQRMVYLIADLLNVSRIQTGKFIIENKPTQLAEVIETELSQLVGTAKSKKLTLTYKKPAKFPILIMDETKIRQVIMNFTDNAIYYTPTGGHIAVKLEDKGKNIEFTVNDDGLGVPKEEQHHMFTKFYRAGNARKARPDGTGLGLFMAKKVIVAQGGAIIFHSVEGKGSTFGFTFAKSKIKPKVPIKAVELTKTIDLGGSTVAPSAEEKPAADALESTKDESPKPVEALSTEEKPAEVPPYR